MSQVFRDEPFARELYREACEKEASSESYPDKEPTVVDQCAYSFLVHLLENTEEKNEPNYSDFLIVSYYRQVLDKLASEDAWKEYLEDWCPEMMSEFSQAQTLLAPYVLKMEEHIKYGIIGEHDIDAYELYQFETYNINQFNLTPWRILNTTYHPEWEEEWHQGNREDVVDTGYLANRFNIVRRFATQQDALDFVKEYYL